MPSKLTISFFKNLLTKKLRISLPLLYLLSLGLILLISLIFPSFNDCDWGLIVICIPPSFAIALLLSLPGLLLLSRFQDFFEQLQEVLGLDSDIFVIIFFVGINAVIYFLVGFILDKLFARFPRLKKVLLVVIIVIVVLVLGTQLLGNFSLGFRRSSR